MCHQAGKAFFIHRIIMTKTDPTTITNPPT
jgi:hypothetical protein